MVGRVRLCASGRWGMGERDEGRGFRGGLIGWRWYGGGSAVCAGRGRGRGRRGGF